jgi:tetratricopeptide (TPR) repeat protein
LGKSILRAIPVAIVFAASLSAGDSRIEDALGLQRQGKSREAREALRAAASDFRASGDRVNQAKALTLAGRISVSLGEYGTAISEAGTAAGIPRTIKGDIGIREDFNTLGLANLYLGNYAAALSNYQQALKLDIANGSAEGEIARENNIGNAYYFQGHYAEALRWYQTAMDRARATPTQTWTPARRQLTIANLAALYQRTGKEQTALNLYQGLAKSPLCPSPNMGSYC